MALPKLDPFILVYVGIITGSIFACFILVCCCTIIFKGDKLVRPKVETENQEEETHYYGEDYNRNPFCFVCWCQLCSAFMGQFCRF